LQKRQPVRVTVIEIRAFRNDWKCFEARGVEPVFLDQEQAIDYAKFYNRSHDTGISQQRILLEIIQGVIRLSHN